MPSDAVAQEATILGGDAAAKYVVYALGLSPFPVRPSSLISLEQFY